MGQIFRPGVSPSTIINPVNVTGVEPQIIFTETDAALNEKRWVIDVQSVTGHGEWSLVTQTDAGAAGEDIIRVRRNGAGLDGIAGIVIGNTVSLDATITFGHAQLIFAADDEVDFFATLVTMGASGAGSGIEMSADDHVTIIAGGLGGTAHSLVIENDGGDVTITSLTRHILLTAGGADGDINLTCSGTGTVNVTGQIVMNQPQLARSSVAYTNNAAAQVATITNGPTAGNPTKWIPINDNGTIRNIPAW